ncbi:MAG TPA: methyltransferase domain-containing protein [Thermoanaerobaculia bacterium]
MSSTVLYDTIGSGYSARRQPDPRIAAQILAALGSARSVLNIGAGAGSYEPENRTTAAVEPSAVMIKQRPPGAAPAVRARAEFLPFKDQTFDAALAVLTLHHWSDVSRGLAECARVARERVVLLTFDPSTCRFWLMQDYFPEFLEEDRRRFPPLESYASLFGREVRLEVQTVPVPRDCADGFLGAYWARPAAYLDAGIRSGISSFAHPGVERGVEFLAADLASGAWHERYAHLLRRDALDLGYRIVTAHLAPAA